MQGHDIIVVGASAGGLQPLVDLVAGLPPDFGGSLLVVMHVTPYHRSRLPEILARAGQLPVAAAETGMSIEPGHVYVAVPDQHLLVRKGKLELSRGPRENRTRPALDPLFRSAAREFGSRVVGIVLSGTQRDGALGLMAIKMQGGITIVQEPQEALYSGMPRSAIAYAEIDYIKPVAGIPSLLVTLAGDEARAKGKAAMNRIDLEQTIDEDFDEQVANQRAGETALFSCPECGGVLWQASTGKFLHFRCHVGHSYSPEILLVEKSESLETALWSAVRTLIEKGLLTRQLANRLESEGHTERAAMVREQADLDEAHAKLIRETVIGAMPNPTSQAYQVSDLIEGTTDPLPVEQHGLDT